MSGIASIFKKKKIDPKEAVMHWKITMRAEERKLDRQIRGIEGEERKLKKEIQQCAKRNDRESEMVHSRKAKGRMFTSKAQMHSVVMQMNQNLATAKVMGHLDKSTEVMQLMNSLVKVPEIMATMRTMEEEMTKAGILEEMIDDVMEDPADEVEEETETEVQKVLDELLVGAASVPTKGLPEVAQQEAVGEVEEPKMDDMQRRLKELQTA